jgi:acyl dehydratase|tara:strand:+ start:14905 stop:15378 length:474 start_codon:yes stop_codon:yes gene_type:complete
MSQSEIISDEMRKFINLKTKPKIYNVDRHSVERFAEAIGDDNPIYFNETYAKKTMGGLIAPPTYVRLLRPNKLEKEFPEPFSNLVDGGSSYNFYEHIYVGDKISVVSKLKDLFIKTGKIGDMLFKLTLISYTNQKKILVTTQEVTTITYGKGEKTFL